MNTKKVFDSDDEIEFECLAPEKSSIDTTHQDCNEEEDNDNDDISATDSDVATDSDIDDAPDDIDFTTSKQTSLERVKHAIQQIQSNKIDIKNKRRTKDKLFKLQKKKRLEELDSKKLPEDFLEKISKSSEVKENKTEKVKDNSEDDSSEEGSVEDRLSDENVPSEQEKEDFIQLENSGGIKPVYIHDIHETLKSSAQAATDFRNKALFGKHIKRESTKEYMAKKRKKKYL